MFDVGKTLCDGSGGLLSYLCNLSTIPPPFINRVYAAAEWVAKELSSSKTSRIVTRSGSSGTVRKSLRLSYRSGTPCIRGYCMKP